MSKHSQKIRQTNRGFSLVELMVIVAVMGAISAMGIVTFTKNWRDVRVRAAAQQSHAWLAEVRSIAIQRSEPCFIEINLEVTSLSLLERTNSCNVAHTQSDDIKPYIPKTSLKNSQGLIICGQDLNGDDPTEVVFSCISSQGGSLYTTFTPRGTITNGFLLKYHLEEVNTDHCLSLIAPIGQIRTGRVNPDETCNFDTTF